MFSERVEDLRGLSGGAFGSIAKWDFFHLAIVRYGGIGF